MGWFKRETQEPKQEHEHVYKDFPWYMETWYNGRDKTAEYRIIEPYVCITCGDRIDKILEKSSWSDIKSDEREKIYNKARQKYKQYLKPRAVVEDMINNVLLVKDPGRLELMERFYGLPHQRCGTSSTMKLSQVSTEKPDVLKIEVEDK